MNIDPKKSVYIKDEGTYISIRQDGEIGALKPTKKAIKDFHKFLKENKIKYKSDFDEQGNFTLSDMGLGELIEHLPTDKTNKK